MAGPRTCVRKQQHSSYNKALASAKQLFIRTNQVCKPYRCAYCDQWHIGHALNKQAQAELERTFRG